MSQSRPLIAVVDDDAIMRTAVGQLLRSADFAVETFPSGADFLESLQSHHPDCVILDIAMPQLDGLAVQARLTQEGIRLPIVVLTGQESSTTRACALAGGASAYLQKSVSRQTLLQAITTAITSPPGTRPTLENSRPQ
jgi:two-component system, LuxR family, response regulator FixJ